MDAAVGRRGLVVAVLMVLAAGMVTGIPSSGPADAVAVVECPSPAPEPQVIMTVGDSITAGIIMDRSTTDSYRAELGRLLDATCIPHRFVTAALDGSVCGYWSDRLAGLMATHHPDVVLLACGTNDRMEGFSSAQVGAWEAMYRTLVSTVLSADPDVLIYPAWVQYSAGHGTAGCLPPQGHSGAEQPTGEAAVNDAIYRVVTAHPEYRHRIPAVIDYQVIPEGYLDACGVHPTPGGYDVMGRIAYNTIAPRLVTPPAAVLPCGLTGRRPGHPVGAWTPCQQMRLPG
ncbi:SGNH/GDSL hydrolase family protein [Micromonospora sp. NPDC048935]|uniref:SGNH/GDSL hydrolase family protein n=1 Tax=Micromonospora sp. NPDC048935 TaxID=3364262 RepID=UPI0037155624